MTGAEIAARATRKAVIPQASGSSRAFSGFFRALMYGAIGISMLALATLLYDVARDGIPKLSWDFLTSFPSRIIPENSGIESAIYGTLYLMVICAVIVIPLGIATAIYEVSDSAGCTGVNDAGKGLRGACCLRFEETAPERRMLVTGSSGANLGWAFKPISNRPSNQISAISTRVKLHNVGSGPYISVATERTKERSTP